MEKSLFVRFYPFILVTSHIAVMALFIFLMNLPREVQIGFLILASLGIAWTFHYQKNNEPPCGASIDGEAIARPRPGFKP